VQVAKPTLVFSGTVTAVDQARYIVAFRVERVWNGELRRESTFFVAPVVEGAQASSFHAGTRYLVAVYGTVRIFNAEDAGSAAVPTPTLFVAFGCKWKETAEADHLEVRSATLCLDRGRSAVETSGAAQHRRSPILFRRIGWRGRPDEPDVRMRLDRAGTMPRRRKYRPHQSRQRARGRRSISADRARLAA